MDLKKLRQEIDRLDARLVELLSRRARVALRIGEAKRSPAALLTFRPGKKVLENVRHLNRGPLPAEALMAIYREIMSASIALEQPVRVAYLGPVATFTHQAARNRFGAGVQYLPCEMIGDIFNAVQTRQADYGVAPVENSIEGAVTHTLDELAGSPLKICAEIYLRISHHLMATRPERRHILRIYSKDQVFGQCRNWLRINMPGVELAPVSSTARAAEMSAREKNTAALASLLAAEMYGLRVLARNVQDSGANTTRFLVLGSEFGAPTGNDKTSVLFSVKHRAGALHRALAVFKHYNINMTKIESRPSRQKAWEYLFFVDIEGHAAEPQVRRALNDLENTAPCARCWALSARAGSPALRALKAK